LLSSIYEAEVLSEEEYTEIVAGLLLEDKPLESSLKNTIDQLKSKICEVLGKEMTPTDDVTIKGIDFPCSMLEQLYSGEWIGTNLIHACLTMSNETSVVKFSQCVSLDVVNAARSKPHRRPFELWAKKISEWKESSTDPLVYFCPLLHDGTHFSLLEINDLDKKICHYDSMAPAHVIAGDVDNPTRVCEAALAEFGDLKFVYEEAPTPQQRDGSSCGMMVIRNARCRMNGLHVGNWNDVLDAEHLRIEVVQLFNSCIQDGSLAKIGKRKRSGFGGLRYSKLARTDYALSAG